MVSLEAQRLLLNAAFVVIACHVLQTTNDIFVNPSVIKTKIAGKLVDDTEQVSGKTKLLGVKREQTPHD